MQKRQFMIELDERSISALRDYAASRGLYCKRGPGAHVVGNVSGLIRAIAADYIKAKSGRTPATPNTGTNP